MGAVLVLYGYLGNAMGIRLPFDPHHMLSQIAGLVLVVMGFVWALSSER